MRTRSRSRQITNDLIYAGKLLWLSDKITRMAGKAVAVCAGALALLVVVTVSHALTMDEDASNNVIAVAASARFGNELAILLRGPREKTAKREELLHVKCTDEASISLFYYRKSNKVSLESQYGDSLNSVSWGLSSHARSTLLLVVTSEKVKLFVGCHALHSHAMHKHNLLVGLSSQQVKVYHEENAPVEVFGSEQAALTSLNCNPELRPPTVLSDDKELDVEDVKEFLDIEERRKREKMLADDYRVNYIDANGVLPTPATQRGDIPANAIETCDDEVIRHLQQLSVRIEQLHRVVADQKGTIDGLRGQLRQCCSRPQPQLERCTAGTCYPGY